MFRLSRYFFQAILHVFDFFFSGAAKGSWIAFLAQNYLSPSRKGSGKGLPIFNIIGIAVGGMVLISVLSVMNGFQLGYIEDIVEVSSSHIKIESIKGIGLLHQQLDKIRALAEVRYVGESYEGQTLIRGYFPRPRGAFIKGIPMDIWEKDLRFEEHIEVVSGVQGFPDRQSVLIGTEMARVLGVSVGDQLSLISLGGESFDIANPEEERFWVRGIFQTGYHEFDVSWAFLPIEENEYYLQSTAERFYSIKLDNLDAAEFLVPAVQKIVGDEFEVRSWKEYNTSFYAALRMEKITMTILLGLIFIVVGLNIFHSLERSILERKEELGLLKAMGATTKQVQVVFLLEGGVMGFAGGILGVLLGLLVSSKVNDIIAGIEAMVNFFSSLGTQESIALYSGSSFYLMEIPVRILPMEVLLVFVFGVLASIGAAWLASQKVLTIRSARVLRAE
jgi:lipoprotein-releasing system permease protein